MERDQFEDLMLTDQKIFAGYAGLFMDLAGHSHRAFWIGVGKNIWRGHSQAPIPPALGSTFIHTVATLLLFRESES